MSIEVETSPIEQLDWEPDIACEHPQHVTDPTHHADGGEDLYRMTCYGGHALVRVRCAKFVDAIVDLGAICAECQSWYGIDGFEVLSGAK